jgi:hypothetical protein
MRWLRMRQVRDAHRTRSGCRGINVAARRRPLIHRHARAAACARCGLRKPQLAMSVKFIRHPSGVALGRGANAWVARGSVVIPAGYW